MALVMPASRSPKFTALLELNNLETLFSSLKNTACDSACLVSFRSAPTTNMGFGSKKYFCLREPKHEHGLQNATWYHMLKRGFLP